jgi:hypothetical protein
MFCMTHRPLRSATAALASASLLAASLVSTVASAQTDQGQYPPPPPGPQGQYPQQGPDNGQYPPPPQGPQGQYPQQGPDNGQYPPPPQGQYGQPDQGQYPQGQTPPPPPGMGQSYDAQAEQADQAYAQRYQAWAAQYCVNHQGQNTAAGAVVGGVFGALLGAAAAGPRHAGAGALVGGAVGAGTGAAIGASRSDPRCPPGYVVAPGAPAFAFAGPYSFGPPGYDPWVWAGGRWVYYPYRYWWWGHYGRPGYWRHRHW